MHTFFAVELPSERSPGNQTKTIFEGEGQSTGELQPVADCAQPLDLKTFDTSLNNDAVAFLLLFLVMISGLL